MENNTIKQVKVPTKKAAFKKEVAFLNKNKKSKTSSRLQIGYVTRQDNYYYLWNEYMVFQRSGSNGHEVLEDLSPDKIKELGIKNTSVPNLGKFMLKKVDGTKINNIGNSSKILTDIANLPKEIKLVSINVNNTKNKIYFNKKLLKQFLEIIASDEIELYFYNSKAGMLAIEVGGDKELSYNLIMPVYVKNAVDSEVFSLN